MPTHILLGAAVAAAALAMITTAVALIVTKKKPGQAPPTMAFFPLVAAILGIVFILALLLNMNEFCRMPKQSTVTDSAQSASPQPRIILPDKRPPAQVCDKRETSKVDSGRYIISKDICITGFKKVDEQIVAEIERQEERFRRDIQAPELMPLSNKFVLNLSTDESTFGRIPEIQSVKLNIDRSVNGAHPSLELRSWTFDRLADRVLDFDLMFQPKSNPKSKLFSFAKKQLTDTEFAENNSWDFDNFMFDGNELIFYFAPGELAPHAAGIQTIVIPLTEIQSILRPPFLNLEPDPKSNVSAPCEAEGGNWLAEYEECEYIGRDWCEQQGGKFLECESACRHDPNVAVCTMQCVPVCQL